MQPQRSSGSTELSRSEGGLARFRSAPATWLETLLESEEEEPQQSEVVLDIPKPSLPNASASDIDLQFPESTASGGLTNFLRMNSSPAEFLSLLHNSEGVFPNLGIPANYYYASEPSAKRSREAEDLDKLTPKLSSSYTPVKGEKGRQLQGDIGGSLNAEMEKIFDDSVMCRARAKRGCATHPRSIAERERRTRISDRIRKLQELVPNLDKGSACDIIFRANKYCRHVRRSCSICQGPTERDPGTDRAAKELQVLNK